MTEVRHFRGARGTDLAYRQIGAGRPLILLHGYFSNAEVNWLKYGHAAALAATGRMLVLPDLRGHGDSAKPHDVADYPPDVLAQDGLALLEHLGIDPADGSAYDLGGYSLGARTTIRMMVLGARPGRAVVAGMGLSGLTAATARSAHFRNVLTNLGSHPPRSAAWMAEAFLRTTHGDPQALLLLLDSFVDTTLAELDAIAVSTAVVLGAEDDDNGSGPELADALGRGLSITVPGNHMSAVTKPELAAAFAGFLA